MPQGISARITNWAYSFVFEFLKPSWFTAIAGASTVAVFGSFIIMIFQALWWNFADVLLPLKVAIPMGYGAVLFHMLRQVYLYLKKREPGSALIATIEFIMFAGSIAALLDLIMGFYGRGVYIGLGENILPIEVRIVVTLAFILPIVFLGIAGLIFLVWTAFYKILEGFGKALKEQLSKSRVPSS